MAVHRSRHAFLLLTVLLSSGISASAAQAEPASRYFRTSDGVRLHYLEAGRGPTIVFVPGWTMPAEIWEPQIRHFAPNYRVIAFDPRGQGASEVARTGYTAARRARDIRELIEHLGPEPVVLVGWSLGVLDALEYAKSSGGERLRALALVDNSIGEEPPPVTDPTFLKRLKKDRRATTERFVRHMYRTPQGEAYLKKVTQSSLRVPLDAAVALLSYPYPREYWKNIVYQSERPILYVVNERFRGQAENLKKNRPAAWIGVFEHAGHALFVDESERFNRLLADFLAKEVRLDAAGGRRE
ncbi:MAG: hypothetical protein A2V92_00905 [Candidatus Muproteobacteria bacterium RBG_16_65_31]|uniref:AB hydrolase-1 domain-containing protein n=1 Tax=Candidatus Muproteobacteria bacterium RBG_16_65_31 TaxID=1817759 RepID=A0A1F6TEG2_9PROT|nr:MAG: hypothetical protein A2V92_00905 [Candidatus Muproteobacteria bacterium RBG_16_65_31]